MNKQLFCEELKKLDLKYEIKNNNEVYIEMVQTDAKKLTETLIGKLKLRFIAEFCRQEEEFIISIILRNKVQGYFVVLYYKTKNEVEALGEIIYQASLFEREIADLYGLKIVNATDERRLVKHELWEKEVYPLRKEFVHGRKIDIKNEIPEYEFKPLFLDGGFQIAVGPVHAGIIEPGHFRFSVIGEEIENLELRFMYKHRGIEKLAENTAVDKLNFVFERVAGESSVAYGEAYALLVEKLMGFDVKRDIKALRTILLELERAYNFLEDIAGICVDIGYSYPAKKLSYFAEEIHQLCERISGSRFLRNSIIPLGTNISFDENKALDVVDTITKIEKRMDKIVETTINAVSFLDRVENTGLVFNEKAKRLGLTGVVGRASGVIYDVRKSYPYEIYKELKKEVNIEEIGGVFERYKLKINEIKDAFVFIRKAIEIIDKDIIKEKAEIKLEKGKEALSIVESVKGELVVYGKVGDNNRFSRIYFKTPSFANWNGLTLAVLGEIVPDFPLCNKSFNMSYSENDR
jgi:Ni,Fe-hydrogenase III large subunit/Ni,Fe-hydrogenase III component G